ncbi:MAG: Fe-S-containing hydro-lyase [Candidatus Poribacteria bacterium]
MNQGIKLTTPLTDKDVAKLNVGDRVFISGIIYTARDAAHKRIVETINSGKESPFDLKGQIIYYAGPSPAKPNAIIGSCGPTTSSRMDAYTPKLLEYGLKGMIGKGKRSEEVRVAIMKNKAVYFSAVGGVAALLSKTIIESEVIAYPDLEPESVRKLIVKNFPVIVAIDVYGNDIWRNT